MSDYVIINGELYHYGVKGMKWGVRRYQNKDGTRTSLGKKHYKSAKESDDALMGHIKNEDDIGGELRRCNPEPKTNSDELKHYGVLGMKWGIRRARKKGVEYAYKSHGQKKYERKLAKQKAKGVAKKRLAKTKMKLEVYKTRDAKRQAYAEHTSVGKAIVQQILTGGRGAEYARFRAAGAGRLRAYAYATEDRNNSRALNEGYELSKAKKDVKKRNKNSRG